MKNLEKDGEFWNAFQSYRYSNESSEYPASHCPYRDRKMLSYSDARQKPCPKNGIVRDLMWVKE